MAARNFRDFKKERKTIKIFAAAMFGILLASCGGGGGGGGAGLSLPQCGGQTPILENGQCRAVQPRDCTGDTPRFVGGVCKPAESSAPNRRDCLLGASPSGNDLFCQAAIDGDSAKVGEFLAAGNIDIHRRIPVFNGRTVLHEASYRGHGDVVRMLAAAGATVTTAGQYGNTPLHGVAGRQGQTAMVAVLLELGADHRAKDADGDTPLHLAARNNRVGVMQMLASRDGNAGEYVNLRGRRESTPLHSAVESCHPRAVAALLTLGADKALKNDKGKTALDIAKERRYADIVALLESSSPLAALSPEKAVRVRRPVALKAAGIVGAVAYALWDGDPAAFEFSPDVAFVGGVGGVHSFRYGSRLDFRQGGWHLYWLAAKSGGSGGGDAHYDTGMRYASEFWSADFHGRSHGVRSDLNFSLRSDGEFGRWRLSPFYSARYTQSRFHRAVRHAFNMDAEWRSGQWTFQISPRVQWQNFGDMGKNIQAKATLRRDF